MSHEDNVFPTHGRDADPHTLKLLGSLGATIAFRSAPKATSEGDALVQSVHGALAAVVALDDHLLQLDDPNAAPRDVMNVREQIAGHFASAQIRIASLNASVDAARAKLEAEQASFYAPAAVTDVAAVLLDIETRASFAATDENERGAIWDRMAKGELTEVLAALCRAPIGQVAVRAREVYRSLAAQRNPGRVRGFEVEIERIDWAAGAVDQLDGALDRALAQCGPRQAVH